MPRKARRIEAALLAKGFQRTDAKHRKFAYVTTRGSESRLRTLLSHGGNRDIDDRLLATMARQCGLSRREFDRLVDCSMSQQQYEALLVERDRL